MALKFFLQTFGCQMNYSDSERVTTVLKKIGYEPVQERNEADLVLLNTCSIKQHAVDRVFGLNKEFEKLRKQNPKIRFGVTGCVTRHTGLRGQSADEIFKKMKEVDFVFKIKDLMKVPSMLRDLGQVKIEKDEVEDLLSYFNISPTLTNISQVFVPIMTGCNNYCSFCIVPYARGKEEYRPMDDIVTEVTKAVKRGAKEINLVGQNVNTYRPRDADKTSKETPFAQILRKIDAIKGVERIRFYAVHPKDMGDDVIALYGELKSMVPHLHLPVQSGSDSVLKRMNRWYNTARFRELAQKLRKQIPSISISTDIIVGFCGETDEEFKQTCDFVRELKIDNAYISKYSEREGTLAERTLKDDIPLSVKKEREKILTEIIKENCAAYNRQFQDQVVTVLVEKVEKGFATGKIPEFKYVRFPSEDPSLVGQNTLVKITHTMEWALEGKPVK